MRFGRCVLDLGSHRMFGEDGTEVAVTAMEFDLLLTFSRNANRVLSRDAILNCIQHRDAGPFDRSIDLHIARLRKKIEHGPGKAAGDQDRARRRVHVRSTRAMLGIRPSSLTGRTLLRIALGVALVILASAVTSYFLMSREIERQARRELRGLRRASSGDRRAGIHSRARHAAGHRSTSHSSATQAI